MGKGYKNTSADAELSTTGLPVVVYDVQMISRGSGDGVCILRNGTNSSGTAIITLTGTTSKGVNFPFGDAGVLFPSGCFIDIDTDVEAVTVSFERI